MDKNEIQKTKWHSLEKEEVIKKLETDPESGITSDKANERLNEFGENIIPKGKKASPWKRFFRQFKNILIYVLIGAAIITAFMEHWIDTGVILGVVLINALIGFIQEGKAEKALESISKMLSLDAVVIRNGNKQTIEASQLVPGDLVLLKAGDKIPADTRLIHAKDLSVEESPLTGESTTVEKNTRFVEGDAVINDQSCMAFSGTMVTYGSGKGIVVATGADTEIGKINKMISDVEDISTPLLQQMEKFGTRLSYVILGVTAVFFAFGYFLRDINLDELFLSAISLIVAAIPEGLPAIVTIALAVGVRKMADRNAIIRRLPSVETLGAVNVICSDKTGTLTRNEMTAKSVTTADSHYEIEGSGYNPEGRILKDEAEVNPEEENVLWKLLQTVRVSNSAEISKDEEGNWKLTGTPTEGALLSLSYKAGLKDFIPEQIDDIPFDSEQKYAASLNKVEGFKTVFITGAPDKLLDICSKQLTVDGEENLNKEFWEEKIDELASIGRRMLGAAFKPNENHSGINHDTIGKENVFLGLVGIIDPPRKEAVDSIGECHDAGVQVKMITGDHVVTAKAIGREIGIGDGEKAITGKELENLSDEEMRNIAKDYDIFARTSPEHKLRLVKALQENGKLCAMTGDGVNDAPALKKANIGIAMGIKGTEVSKNASEMVLADDNFASIVNAIEEGRTVYDNIRKAILFILPTNGAESLVVMSAILLGIVMPITPVQILWVNMVTAVTLALAIAFEPMEDDVMARPPRKSGESILNKMFIWRIIFVSFVIGGFTLLIYNIISGNNDQDYARTVAVNTLVAGQLFYLFNCRKIKSPAIQKGFFTNRYIFYAVGALILLQVIFTYVPFMNNLFSTSPLNTSDWLYPLSAGLTVFLIVELEKYIILKFKK